MTTAATRERVRWRAERLASLGESELESTLTDTWTEAGLIDRASGSAYQLDYLNRVRNSLAHRMPSDAASVSVPLEKITADVIDWAEEGGIDVREHVVPLAILVAWIEKTVSHVGNRPAPRVFISYSHDDPAADRDPSAETAARTIAAAPGRRRHPIPNQPTLTAIARVTHMTEAKPASTRSRRRPGLAGLRVRYPPAGSLLATGLPGYPADGHGVVFPAFRRSGPRWRGPDRNTNCPWLARAGPGVVAGVIWKPCCRRPALGSVLLAVDRGGERSQQVGV